MMDIELCGFGATVVIWYGSDVLSPALGFILEDGPTPCQSVYVCVCGSVCFAIAVLFCVCVWFCSCVAVCTMNL